MPLTGFNRELGTTQGRITPAGWIAPDGSYVFCLGRDLAGMKHTFNIGDYVQVQQVADLYGAKLMRVSGRMRPPAVATPGAQWVFKVIIDGTTYVQHALVPGRIRDRVDLAVNVSRLAAGDHTIRFRLELVAA